MRYFTEKWALSTKPQRLDLIKKQIPRLYINKDLIDFLKLVSDKAKSNETKIFYLRYCKKIVSQAERKPDVNHQKAFSDEYKDFFVNIANEQIAYDPLIWIDAELEYLNYISQYAAEHDDATKEEIKADKDWLTFKEVMAWLQTSKSALNRRISDGMPCIKLGNQLRFSSEALSNWLTTNG